MRGVARLGWLDLAAGARSSTYLCPGIDVYVKGASIMGVMMRSPTLAKIS